MRRQDGYVALLSVLVLGAIAIAVALALLTSGTDRQRESLVLQQSTQAQSLAVSCAQEALQVVHDTTTYTGTASLTLGSGSCSYTVTSTGASTRTITVSANVSSVTRKLQIYATINATSISITSWQEVS
jgi:type II secretory pathway component PulK